MVLGNLEEVREDLKRQIAESQNDDEAQAQSEEVVDQAEEEVTPADEEVQEEAEPEEEEEQEEESDDTPPKKEKTAWARMRHEVKEAKEELAKLKEAQAKQQGFNEAMQMAQQPAAPQENRDPEPDQDLDPDEHKDWQIRQLRQQVEGLSKTTEETQQAQKTMGELRGVQILEGQFKQSNPDNDYDAALAFVKQRETQLIQLQYPTATMAQINSHLENQKLELFRQLAPTGRNPAETIVEMAKAHGYEPVKSDPKSKKAPNLQNLKKNMKKNTSLIGGSPATNNDGASPDAIFNMSMDDIMKNDTKQMFKKAHKHVG